jgi:hypothetical protein
MGKPEEKRIELPSGVVLGQAEEKGGKESRLALHVTLERPDAIFQEFDVRFVFAPLPPGAPVFLEFERPLRANERFVARFELRDEVTGAVAAFDRAVVVPSGPTPDPAEVADVRVGEVLGVANPGQRDTVLLLPPVDDVLFGLWRAEAIVGGDRITKLVFLLDGKPQLTRTQPPWTAELRLPSTPKEAVARVEGLDRDGKVIAADEVLLNEPQAEARVKLLAPPRGQQVSGRVRAKAAVVAPSGERVEKVEFKLNDETVATLTMPPWEATIEVPEGESLAYLTVVATYADGNTAEDFRVLNSGEIVEEIEVDLVEVYVAVSGRDGAPAEALEAKDFQVLDNGRPQTISKFELVRELPLTLGLVLDTSGSMEASMAEAKLAAARFLDEVVKPKDRTFAVAFSERPRVVLPLTSDAKAIQVSFRDLPALGATSLHDAIIYSLYQFRGVRGQKAMVLLSDGDDTASKIGFDDALSYVQRAGVAIGFVEHVDGAIACRGTDVIREVEGAVEVPVGVLAGVVLAQPAGNPEERNLTTDREVLGQVATADEPDGRNGGDRGGEFGRRERRCQLHADVGVFEVDEYPSEPPAAIHEVVLVAEAERLEVGLGADRESNPVQLPVEDELPLDRGRPLVLDGQVFEAELVLRRRTEDDVQLAQLLLLDPEVFHQVHVGARDTQRLGVDDEGRVGVPPPVGHLDVVLLADCGLGRSVELGRRRVLESTEHRDDDHRHANPGCFAHHSPLKHRTVPPSPGAVTETHIGRGHAAVHRHEGRVPEVRVGVGLVSRIAE